MDLECQLASKSLFESGLLGEVIGRMQGKGCRCALTLFSRSYPLFVFFWVYYYYDGDGANVRWKSPLVC